ncbi:sm-like protein LSM36B [Prunus yedoensis var. nudiflora]|uniref:Sm-like protein LSM36B n=1 Tax=Prunus yedoensis var. nudiflora TaxID=2094558 RepID=A0A314XY96_PRUYE|nr:sm-like protein LSM36B [Prunus yedoensis var. nudiflora]
MYSGGFVLARLVDVSVLYSSSDFANLYDMRCKKLRFRIEKMSGGGEKGTGTTKTPADFLKSIRGRPVVVKLNSGVDYRGILACLDGYMNIAMEQTEEYVNGQLKNKYGDAFIRGNNVLYISTTRRNLADGA